MLYAQLSFDCQAVVNFYYFQTQHWFLRAFAVHAPVYSFKNCLQMQLLKTAIVLQQKLTLLFF